MQKSASLASYSAASDQKRLKIYSCFASVNTMSLPRFTSGSERAAGCSGKEDPSMSAGRIVHTSQCCCQRISFFFEGYSKYCLQPWDVKDKYAAGKAADLM